MNAEQWEQLPASDFSPVPVETLDWDVLNAELHAVEFKLALIKRDFRILYPPAEAIALAGGS